MVACLPVYTQQSRYTRSRREHQSWCEVFENARIAPFKISARKNQILLRIGWIQRRIRPSNRRQSAGEKKGTKPEQVVRQRRNGDAAAVAEKILLKSEIRILPLIGDNIVRSKHHRQIPGIRTGRQKMKINDHKPHVSASSDSGWLIT